MPALVLDTNIVLDLLVFDDPSVASLKAALERRDVNWVATRPMRDELERVLGYAHIAARLGACPVRALDVLAGFDRQACLVEAPPKAAISCADPDDQKFIDLALAHRCLVVSKDADVLAMHKRMAALGAGAVAALPSSF